MTIKSNTAEGGSNGTTITQGSGGNTGGSSGDYFDVRTIQTGAALVFTTSQKMHGSLAYQLTNASGGATQAYWNSFSASQIAARMYFRLDSLPSVTIRLLDIRTSGGVAVGRVLLNSSNILQFQTNSGSTNLKTFGSAVSVDTWYRLEVVCESLNASNATFKCDYYAGDSTSPVETGYSSTTVSSGTTSAMTEVRFGNGVSAAWTGNLFFDDVAAEDARLTYLGVASTAFTVNGTPGVARAGAVGATVTTSVISEGPPATARAGSGVALVSTSGAVVVSPSPGRARAAAPRATVTISGAAGSEALVDATVEVAFNAGYTGTPTWTDVTDYVRHGAGIGIGKWRGTEDEECQPNTLSLTLDNSDGRFTPGNTTSPYYPNVKRGRPIRVRRTVDGTTYERYYGYVNDWAVDWPAKVSTVADCQVSASSRLARLGSSAELKSVIEEYVRLHDPLLYWPFGDPEGATVIGDESGNGGSALATAGTGTAVVFGNATGPGTDSLTAAEFAAGKYLITDASPRATGITLSLFFNTTGSGTLASFEVLGLSVVAGKLRATSPGGLTVDSSASVNDGETHHAALTRDGSTVELFLDGISVGTVASTELGELHGEVAVGSGFTGAIAHVAMFDTVLGDTDISDIADAGLTGFEGETVADRLTRYASLAGLSASQISFEDGQTADLAHVDTTDKTALAVMREVETTEGGVLFDAADGTLTFHDRAHRYNAASSFTLDYSAGHIANALSPVLDDQLQVNDLTATNSDGVSARVTDSTSAGDYGPYRKSLDLATTDADEPYMRATWVVNRYAEPEVRVSTLEVNLRALSDAGEDALVADLLSATFGDKFTLDGLPANAPATSMDLFIEGMSETISADTHILTLRTSPASKFEIFRINDSVRGVINGSYPLGY